jgi:hypothetical protein
MENSQGYGGITFAHGRPLEKSQHQPCKKITTTFEKNQPWKLTTFTYFSIEH